MEEFVFYTKCLIYCGTFFLAPFCVYVKSNLTKIHALFHALVTDNGSNVIRLRASSLGNNLLSGLIFVSFVCVT